MSLTDELYPEIRAGGYTRVDGNIEFYGRINSLASPEMRVLDFGAGRGKDATDDPVAYRRNLRDLRGKVAEVIGVDTDSAVLTNPSLDRAVVIDEGDPIPLATASVDLVVSDFCFEHLRSPRQVVVELDRVLKVGGWICARTPNRWGYIGMATNLVPNALHRPLLQRIQPGREPRDVFPTEYRLNTRRRVRAAFPPSSYADCTYGHNSEPAYFGNWRLAARIAKLWGSISPEGMSALLYIFLQKQEQAESPSPNHRKEPAADGSAGTTHSVGH